MSHHENNKLLLLRPGMDISEAILSRRSIKVYNSNPVSNETISILLELAVAAPNHRMTQPWRFYVMGPESRAGFGTALGRRKAKKVTDEESAKNIIEKVKNTHRALPAMIAVGIELDDNPEIREEDYAASYMAIQNFCLAACSMGLGTHVKTGAVMDDPSARKAIGVRTGERIVATITLGEPADIPEPKSRELAANLTTWNS